jgi:transmembrane sensor
MRVRSSMGNVPRGPSVADEAAEWLATLTDGSCTEDERQRFVDWLKRSNLHVDEFLRVSALSKRLTRSDAWPQYHIDDLIAQAHAPCNVVTALPDPARLGAGVETAGVPRSAPGAMEDGQGARLRSRGTFGERWGWALAAAVAPLIVIATLLVIKFDPLELAGGTYATAIGELRSITLEDGSVVELNTSSKVRTHFSPKLREVQLLSGEAVFKVAKNPARPFRVSTGSTQIVAVGTEFNVYARQSKTVVTVIEGRVRVTDHPPSSQVTADTDRNFELSIGEQAVIAPHMPISRIRLADSRSVKSWTERRLIFEDTPLSEAADEFARYNRKLIRLEDPKLRELKVTGVFNATDPASLVEFIEAYGSVKVQAEQDGWTLDSSAR